ncbi:MAG: hypothetical protein U0794_11795 [Isosphaeraceae bacterium]
MFGSRGTLQIRSACANRTAYADSASESYGPVIRLVARLGCNPGRVRKVVRRADVAIDDARREAYHETD